MKQRLTETFASLPPVLGRLYGHSMMDRIGKSREYAEQLVQFRLPLKDGSTTDFAPPCDWYGERLEPAGPRAPAIMQQRLWVLDPLVAAWRETSDDRYAEAAHAYVMDYVSRFWRQADDVPPGEVWLCLAVRCGCLEGGGLYTLLRELHAHPSFSDEDLAAVVRAITHMVNALVPHLALGSNWRVHELNSLLTHGLCYPFLPDAARWLQIAVNGLNEEFAVQFHRDGSHEELTILYGASMLYAFSQFFALSRELPELGLCVDANKLETILGYYLSSRKPFGTPAGLGDVYVIRTDDELRRDAPVHRDGDGLEAVRAHGWPVLDEAADLLRRYVRSSVADFILRGSPEPEWTSRFHDDSGYLFLRDGWESESLYLNCNLGYFSNCHCHYGLLGIEVAAYGRELIVDPGLADFSAHPINQNFYNTRAHNTLTVDGLNQHHRSPVKVSRLALGERYDFAVGVYEGGYFQGKPFSSWKGGVAARHFRHLLFVKHGYWVVLDALATDPGHTIETRFQFMPTVMHPLPGGGSGTGYSEGNLAILPLAWDGWEYGIRAGEEDPVEGWLPTAAGRYVPAPVYKAVRPSSGGADWHGSLLFPYAQATMPRVEVRPVPVGPIGFAWEIVTDAWRDLLFVSNSWMPRPYRLRNVESDACLCHQRFVDGRAVQGFTCEGNFLRVDGKELFCEPGTMLARELDYRDGLRVTPSQPRR